MRVITSETALKYLEEDVVGTEKEITRLDEEIAKQPDLQAEFDQVLQVRKIHLRTPIRNAT